MKRRNSFEADVNHVVGLIALALVVGAIAWFLEVLVAVVTSPVFLVAAPLVALVGLILWLCRDRGNGRRSM